MRIIRSTGSQGAWSLVAARRLAVAGVATTAVVGGLVEALFLVLMTRSAFALTDDADQLDFVAGTSMSLGGAVVVGLVLIVLRVGLAVANTWQSARLLTDVIADLRQRLASAFLKSSWDAQHGERAGRLQELLTTFTQNGANLVTSVLQGLTSGFSLVALLVTAVVLDPVASVGIIIAVAILSAALRPLRSAVKRQARSAAATGMEFATSLSEISELGMEMHVFNVQPQTEQRVLDLISANAESTRRLSFLRGMVPTLYTGLAYLALWAGSPSFRRSTRPTSPRSVLSCWSCCAR